MKNKEIEELLNDIKKQLLIDERLGKEIAQDFHKTTLNYKEIKILLSYLEQLENNRDKATEYANNCLNNINDCVKNGNYTIKELTSWVPTLQCIHNSYLKILKGDSD